MCGMMNEKRMLCFCLVPSCRPPASDIIVVLAVVVVVVIVVVILIVECL